MPGQEPSWDGELRYGFAVGKDELNRGAGRDADAQNPVLLLAFKDALLLAIGTKQPVGLGVADLLSISVHGMDLLC